FFFQAEDGIRDRNVTGVQTCALPICRDAKRSPHHVVTYSKGSNALHEHRELLRLFDQLETGTTPPGFRIEMQPILPLQHHTDTRSEERRVGKECRSTRAR